MIAFCVGANMYYVPTSELTALLNTLHRDGSAGATALRDTINAATGAAIPDPIRLGPDDIAALGDAICGDLFIGFPALSSLQNAICREHPDYVFRDA